ncbi:MAG: cytochrome P460 family protein [Polyangiaceae bacterium]|nr:cytochrome P460 family protein [Polyangiaceae bacterium]
MSDHRGGGVNPHLGSDAGVVDGTAALPRDYRTRFKKMNNARFVSSGHAAGRWEVDVWANDAASTALASRARDVPEGAALVQEHFERQSEGGSVKGPIMVMEKREKGFAPSHGDWSFTVVGSAGQLVKQGIIEQCAGCHDDAPIDGLFPIME